MNTYQTEELIGSLEQQLRQMQSPDGMWRGRLSSSAVSTAVAIFALWMADRDKYSAVIRNGADWLLRTMDADGTWGDSPESPSNMTATLLSFAALYAVGEPVAKTKEYLGLRLGGATDRHLISGVLRYYGKDLTFSAPILVMCALAGVISDWENIPSLPFELSVLPQRLFRWAQLPVVSYAIPALIAVGILRYKKGKRNIFSPVRELFVNKSLKVLCQLQPSHGGFLEAAPLTAFVAMCLCGAGFLQLSATQKAAAFLTSTVRSDGSWPIDTDLSCWVSSLSVRALGSSLEDPQKMADLIKSRAFKTPHPFTGAPKGGWGWSDLPGSVPDADDTCGALVALHRLTDGGFSPEIGNGIAWLLQLQNNDGGMPTFCKGWGKLPFDRSSADISAHALLAFQLWVDQLPDGLIGKTKRSIRRLLNWLEKNQASDGSWTPLWFGDQHDLREVAPVYATAMTVEYLSASPAPQASVMAHKGIGFLLAAQNQDGGWGGNVNTPSRVTFTARSLGALAAYPEADRESISRGLHFLEKAFREGTLLKPEPIGLYFARLWYSEELYNITFVLQALKALKKIAVNPF